jgi:hypothetical protein
MENARFSPQIDHAGRRMDSKVVNQGIRGRIWPRLRERGFGTFSSRSAWRHRSDRIEVVNFQSFNAYNAGVIGCTTFSFAVNLGCYLLAIPPRFEPSRIKATKGHLVPEEFACHFRGQLSPDVPQPKLLAKNIWFIDETGSNLALSLDDAWAALDGSGLPWFEQFASPAEVLRILRHEPEQQGHLWGFGNNPSPVRHYFIGYAALNLNDGILAKDHLQHALASGCFSSVEERLAKDIERAGK